MRNVSKRLMKLAIFSVAAVVLTACGTTNNEKTEGYVQPNFEEEVIFIQKYDNNHIDVIAGDVKKMYAVPKDFKKVIEKVKKNDVLLIEYTLDNELKRNVTNIQVVGGDFKQPSAPVAKVEKPKKEDKVVKAKIKIYSGGKWIEKESALMKNGDKFSIQILNGYTLIGNQIESNNNPSHYVSIEELPLNTEIQPERWAASDILKKLGDLKELKGNGIYDPNFKASEFVFSSSNNDITKNIVVLKKGDHLLRYTMAFPKNNEGNEIQADLWAMMWNISFD